MPDLDTWEVTVVDVNDQPLVTFQANYHGTNQEGSVILNLQGTHITATGTAHEFLVTKNSKLFARDCSRYRGMCVTLHKGNYDPGALLYIQPSLFVKYEPHVPKVCTCGGWAVYGKEANIHSDDRVNICDLRRP